MEVLWALTSIVAESGFDYPEYPTLFLKPNQTIANTREPVPIPKLAQAHCDYEGELTIVIGKDAKNVSEADALDYVAGYVVGNDISCRDWQLEKAKAGMIQQWCFSKSFDKYAPLGPAIVSTKVLGDGTGLRLRTYVNGDLRQDSNTSDLLFGVRKLVSFLSTGQTLEKGSLIMSGTPGGVGAAMKPKPQFLKDGDEVVVEIEGIGKLRNVMQFE
jgi:2-keto-4-pentenoate hydratase/2-oxohepta-3-ene-1,7-dioic acid hydratase in catechol pathway